MSRQPAQVCPATIADRFALGGGGPAELAHQREPVQTQQWSEFIAPKPSKVRRGTYSLLMWCAIAVSTDAARDRAPLSAASCCADVTTTASVPGNTVAT
jgi:hypothetical protein